MDNNNNNNKIPKTDYNLISNNDDDEMRLTSNREYNQDMPEAANLRRGNCYEDLDCLCFDCSFDCCDF